MKTNIYKKCFYALLTVVLVFTTKDGFSSKPENTVSFYMNCPADAYVSCTDELWNLSAYGNATYTYGYNTYSAGNPTVHYYLNSCNAGYITRTWMVEDYNWQWHSCTQTIYVSSTNGGGPVIDWPEDIELQGCNPDTNPYHLPSPNNYPTWDYNECSMLGKSYSDMVFTVNSQCKKVMRTWKILDWCNYSPTNGYGIYSRVQFIYIINNTAPVFTCPTEITVNSFNCKDADVISVPLTIDPSVCGGNFQITNNSKYAASKGNNISGKYPIGTTKVTYTVQYGCGKTKTCTTNVIVKNGSRPTPYCNGQLVTTLMGVDTDHDGKIDNGMVELWAKDLNKNSWSACNNYPLKFSFSSDVTETSKTFTCNEVGTNMVQMWVTDSKGAQSYCLVEVIIQNNGANIPNCHPKPVTPVDPVYSLKGNVSTLTDTPLKDAIITVEYKNPVVTYQSTYDTTETLELDSFINYSGYKLYRYILVKKITEKKDSTVQLFSKTVTTNEKGNYLMDSIAVHDQAFTISGAYTDDAHRFIDNKDVELLTKFLLGDVTFSSYQQYLASDINEDGKIDIVDQNLLMEFVTNNTASLPGNHQWYLLDKKATFVKPEDVLQGPVPLTIMLDSIQKIHPAIDFVAIKKGNISIDPGSILEAEIEVRNKVNNYEPVTVYPNPFADQLTFNISASEASDATLQFFNSNGQEIRLQRFNLIKGQNEINVQMSDEAAGLLLYRWSIGSKVYSGTLSRIK